ncbi:uncharacterized protein LOC133817951 [Humulus lupulus]|uniref:uncharacterized protein LOC133817951 n=1 Tax=Humulus lupulus TaxID=3486 RepID=UPI002B4078FF|nr:uncharacterized protein LOC133817951 [Humulus lupulus]
MNEFLNLVQGNASMTEYATEFDELAKFSLDMVPTDMERKKRFIQGLNPGIAQGIRVAPVYEVSTYAQVVEKALAVESMVVGQQSAGEHGAQIVVPPLSGASKKKSWKTEIVCNRCKRRHLGECRAKACFLCDMVGHLKKDCSRLKELEQMRIDSLTPARMFTPEQIESGTETSSSGVAGQFSSSDM